MLVADWRENKFSIFERFVEELLIFLSFWGVEGGGDTTNNHILIIRQKLIRQQQHHIQQQC